MLLYSPNVHTVASSFDALSVVWFWVVTLRKLQESNTKDPFLAGFSPPYDII